MVTRESENKLQKLRNRKPRIMGYENAFKSAVLLPLVDKGGEECILFEKRSATLDHQPGEICFPGGKIEAYDGEEAEAALRETCEELGLGAGQVEVIAPLDLLITPFNAIIYPFVGRIQDLAGLKPNPDEVETVFYVPLSFLLEYNPLVSNLAVQMVAPPDYPFDLIPGGDRYPFRQGVYPQLFYQWEEYVIWGLTARILNHFLTLIR